LWRRVALELFSANYSSSLLNIAQAEVYEGEMRSLAKKTKYSAKS